ncbi:RNA polymerase, sigma-24 subunit, ECF subfamily [gut metagenome]|uniref:RNA polymerase, sigma-24 subunit, ECF subfamily n=1 Tax=gut metagenome TaxID=749906 RepID=J9G8Q6_9ZZZZ
MDALATKILTPEEAVSFYGALVLRTAYGMVKNQQDAEDIAQEVFLNMLKRDPFFECPEHQKAWLIRCTLNRCKSHFRSVWQSRTDGLEDTLAIPFDPEENVVMDAVRNLPLKYRQVIYLHYIQGYATAEIASILNIKQNTVLSQLARGRKILEKTLKGAF